MFENKNIYNLITIIIRNVHIKLMKSEQIPLWGVY
jgi:hypothetical protein